MADHQGLPVEGYKPVQAEVHVSFVNELKRIEELYNRWLDQAYNVVEYDARCINEARTQLQTATMWAVRGVFQPQRIKLPGE